MTWSDFTSMLPALAGSAAVAGFILSLVAERHPLTAIDRLSNAAERIRAPEKRALVEDYRDEQTVRWVLEQRAPAERGRWWVGLGLRILAGLAFASWLLGTWAAPTSVLVWAAYACAIVSYLLGTLALFLRTQRRNAWMDQERSWRRIAVYEPASVVRRN